MPRTTDDYYQELLDHGYSRAELQDQFDKFLYIVNSDYAKEQARLYQERDFRAIEENNSHNIALSYIYATNHRYSDPRIFELYYDRAERRGEFNNGEEDIIFEEDPNDLVQFGEGAREIGFDELFHDVDHDNGRRVHHIGAAFDACKQIIEYEDDLMYIPTSYYCALKCMAKYFNYKLETPIMKLSPFGQSPNAIKTFVTNVMKQDWECTPALWKCNKRGILSKMNRNHVTSAKARIILVKMEGVEYHAVLDKNIDNHLGYRMVLNNIKFGQDLALNVDEVKVDEFRIKPWVDDYYVFDIETFVTPRAVRATSTRSDSNSEDEKVSTKSNDLLPAACAWMKVNVNKEVKEEDVHMAITRIKNVGEHAIEALIYDNCIMDMIEQIVDHEKTLLSSEPNFLSCGPNFLSCGPNFLSCGPDVKKPPTIYIYAHYGSMFDNRFTKLLSKLKFIDQIANGSQLKSLTAQYKGFNLLFRDSFLFTQSSLKESAIMLKTKFRKIEGFNIKDKPFSYYTEIDARLAEYERCKNENIEFTNEEGKNEPPPDWRVYLKFDVLSLAEVCQKFDLALRKGDGKCLEIGESLCGHMGLPGIAWSLIVKNCYEMKHVYRAKDPVTEHFLRSACYGGRILHWKKYFEARSLDEWLISIDGNSLYPSAMWMGAYPTGRMNIIEEKNYLASYLMHLTNLGQLYVAEVIMTNNCRYSLVPYRLKNGCVIYKSGTIQGVYTSVDIEEALNDGWKIEKVLRGVYWVTKAYIFKDLIEALYNERQNIKNQTKKELKPFKEIFARVKQCYKEGLVTEEEYNKAKKEFENKEGECYNGMEYVFKILLNSLYGKLLEVIDGGSSFSSQDADNLHEDEYKNLHKLVLPNGQIENRFTYRHSLVKKPVQLGAFVLSYSRAIMNNLIRKVGVESIYYGDTDSIYVHNSAIKDFEFKDGLGGFKNDYGDETRITKMIILDNKRYYLEILNVEKNETKSKAKFNGLNFKTENALSNWIDLAGPNMTPVRKMYEWFHEHPEEVGVGVIQEKWNRTISGVHIDEQQLKFQVNPNKRGMWFQFPDKTQTKLEDRFYAIDFDISQPEVKLGPIRNLTPVGVTHSDQYALTLNGLYSALPIMGSKTIMLSKKQANGFVSEYVVKGNTIYRRQHVKNYKKNGSEREKIESGESQTKVGAQTRAAGQAQKEFIFYNICDCGPKMIADQSKFQMKLPENQYHPDQFDDYDYVLLVMKQTKEFTPSKKMNKEETELFEKELKKAISRKGLDSKITPKGLRGRD